MSPTKARAPDWSHPSNSPTPRVTPVLLEEPRPSPTRPPRTPTPEEVEESRAASLPPEPSPPTGARGGAGALFGKFRPSNDGPLTTSSDGDRGDGGDGGDARSGAGRVDLADAAARTIGQLLLVLSGVAGWLVVRRSGGRRALRAPSEAERAEVAEPVAAILVRHVGGSWLSADLLDVTRAAAGTAAYLQSDPLVHVQAPADVELTLPDGSTEAM